MTIPHGGGKRFAEDRSSTAILSEWIAAGTPPPARRRSAGHGPRSLSRRRRAWHPAAEQQLVVHAKYSDGQVRDVTRWVKFSSSDEGVATVDDSGHVKMNGTGEAAITLYYSSRVLYSRLSVPFPNKVDPAVYDEISSATISSTTWCWPSWKALQHRAFGAGRPTPPSSAAPTSMPPAFCPPPKKWRTSWPTSRRTSAQKLIDGLLERDEFVDYWAYKWSDLLLVSSRKLRPNAMWSFYNWIRDSVKQNKPWDQFAREIFTASGNTRQNGALNYFVLHKDPIDIAENATQAFLGQRLTCARCHNHPLEKWTQKQYYQFANLFSRVGVKNGDRAGRRDRVRQGFRRHQSSAAAEAAAAHAARRHSPCRSIPPPIAACISPSG